MKLVVYNTVDHRTSEWRRFLHVSLVFVTESPQAYVAGLSFCQAAKPQQQQEQDNIM
jgi:hypothetical protein